MTPSTPGIWFQTGFLTAALLFSAGIFNSASAGNDIEIPLSFPQDDFRNLSREVGLMISFSQAAPAEPLGLTGFDAGIEVSVAKIEADKSFWVDVVGKEPPEYWALPKLHFQKGLPFGFDVGAVYGKAPGSNIGLVGGELKYAILKGNAVMPALAIRGHYTALLGVDDLDMGVYGGDLSISKGLGFLTPYAGIGQVWIESEEKSGLNPTLGKESLSETKGFLGFKLSLFLVSFVAEADFSSTPSYTARLNLSF
ncbi:MAG TPA: hypothetical protein VLB09_06720 [Nitrospiria bacterium]|nr:hypothetical protein [Nitrospiria bacterium]